MWPFSSKKDKKKPSSTSGYSASGMWDIDFTSSSSTSDSSSHHCSDYSHHSDSSSSCSDSGGHYD